MVDQKEKRYQTVQVKLSPSVAKKVMARIAEGQQVMTMKNGKVFIAVNLPAHIAWHITRKIGPNSITALATLFLYQFSQSTNELVKWKTPKGNILNKLVKDFLKQFAVGKAGLHLAFEPTQETGKEAGDDSL